MAYLANQTITNNTNHGSFGGSLSFGFAIVPNEDVNTQLILQTYSILVLAMFGTITNAFNCVIFYRQGVISSCCVPSFMGLAVSDFSICFLSVYRSLLTLPILEPLLSHKVFLTPGIVYVINNISQLFIDVTCTITVFLSMERMLSVILPLKISSIFTPKRAGVIVCCIFIASVLLNSPTFINSRLMFDEEGQFYVHRIRGLLPMEFYTIRTYYKIFIRSTSVLLVIIFNSMLIIKVAASQSFRKSFASANETIVTTFNSNMTPGNDSATTLSKSLASGAISTINSTIEDNSSLSNHSNKGGMIYKNKKTVVKSSKEMRLIRMMLVLCALYIICYLPIALYMIVIKVFETGLDLNFFAIFKAASDFLEIINSTFNAPIYFVMSARYRKELRRLCVCHCVTARRNL